MLTKKEIDRIYRQAYIPDHLPDYVSAISDAEPFLHKDCLCFVRRKHLIFIGYPLENPTENISHIYESACRRFKPATVALTTPKIWLPSRTYKAQPPDSYYRLELPMRDQYSAVNYMVRRAQKELNVSLGHYGREHSRIIKNFLANHELTDSQKHIYRRISHYLKRAASTRLLETRKEKTLVAFTIVDFGSADYAFYMFNFRSSRMKIPGASDLLFFEMVNMAQSEGRKAINLGLGIHSGIRRFKEKWGGVPFLSHESTIINNEASDLEGLAKKL